MDMTTTHKPTLKERVKSWLRTDGISDAATWTPSPTIWSTPSATWPNWPMMRSGRDPETGRPGPGA